MSVERTWAIVKTAIFTILVPGFVGVLVPEWLRTSPASSLTALRITGAGLTLIGALIYLRCAWDFAYTGLGTPAPLDPPKRLVANGFHRIVRNPMYVGVLLVILGQGALFGSRKILIYGACFWLTAHLFVIFYEEPTLETKFGGSYVEYRRVVPRWIPRLRHRRKQPSPPGGIANPC